MKRVLLPLIAGVAALQPLHGKFAMPQPVPVERLVASAQRYIEKSPEDPEGHYTLARIHYAAFAWQATYLDAFSSPAGDDAARPPALDRDLKANMPAQQLEAQRRVLERRKLDAVPRGDAAFAEEVQKEAEALTQANWQPPAMAPADALRHFLAARDGFEKAISMAPDNAMFALGKASLWRQFSTPELHAPLEKEAGVPAAMKNSEVAALFYKAFTLAKGKDAELKHLPLRGLSSIISNEAGIAYLELTPEGEHAVEVKEHLAFLKELKMGAITPLVFSTRPEDLSLAQVVNEQSSVAFDLRGMGEEVRWPWLHSHAAFLVWDAENTGIIRDGRQLFGSYTWGVFWRDGFEAISMLDDDGNESLRGSELKGIRVWQDRNGNSISEPGEVRDLPEFGISAIACSATSTDGGSLVHSQGVTLSDGSQRPLWDWVLRPLDAGEPRSIAP